MTDAINRESLRAATRALSDEQRRIALERAVERLPDATLEELLGDLVMLQEHRTPSGTPPPSLSERIAAHVDATRRGDFLGKYEMRNRHGQREPSQTRAWIAATWHLLDLARKAGDEANLRALKALVEEVDERPDELVVFEDANAGDHFGIDLDRP